MFQKGAEVFKASFPFPEKVTYNTALLYRVLSKNNN